MTTKLRGHKGRETVRTVSSQCDESKAEMDGADLWRDVIEMIMGFLERSRSSASRVDAKFSISGLHGRLAQLKSSESEV